MISNDDSPLPGTEVHFLRSDHVGDEFKILVGHCGPSDATSLPVLFVSDTIWTFGTAVEIVRLLNFVGDLPAMLVVGIGYRASTVAETFGLRSRDFTPTADPDEADNSSPGTGGASRFLAFIREELKPWVSERFDTDMDDCTFFGDSLGGLFATYVLFTEPATFARYGIGSPSYWWDDDMMFQLEAEYAQTHTDLDAKVFVSVGEYETPPGAVREREQRRGDARAKAEAADEADPPIDMVERTERMSKLLLTRNYQGLHLECQVLAGEYHQTAPPVNLSRSLRFLFDAPR